MTRDEGVIKFECRWRQRTAPDRSEVERLIEYRQKLFALGLIGVYPDGIGFGNLSERSRGRGEFIISASQTGHLSEVDAEHFVYVTEYSVDYNWLACEGPSKASSESLTHAMIYETFADCNAVAHVHNSRAWEQLQGHVPTSGKDVPYGTPAMGQEVRRLARESTLAQDRIFVMSGHEDGVLAFGTDLELAFATLLKHIKPSIV